MSSTIRSPSFAPRACNCLALRQAARHVTQLYDQLLSDTALRTTQYSILSRLQRVGPTTINALAAELVTDRTTLGRNLRPLERDGLIAIERADDDRRSKRVVLTKAGRARFAAASKRWAAAQVQFETAFGRAQSEELRALLGKVVDTPLVGSTDADPDDDT